MYIKYLNHIHPHSCFHFTLPPSASNHPQTGPYLPFCPSLFKYIMIKWVFCVVFHICIYCTLIRLAPSVNYFYLSPYSSNIQGLSVHFIMLSSCTDAVDFNITHSLSVIFPPPPHSSPL
jgi:hypothetical protein